MKALTLLLASSLLGGASAATFDDLARPLASTLTRLSKEARAAAPAPASAVRPLRQAPVQEVTVKDDAFAPAVVTIPRGARVRWLNRDAEPHTATGLGRVFDTGTLSPGESGEAAFHKPGTFVYHCAYHPHMKGTVIVQ